MNISLPRATRFGVAMDPESETVAFLSPERIKEMEPLTSDAGNATRFAMDHAPDLCYVAEWGWLCWNDSNWARDRDGEVMRRAVRTAHKMYSDAWSVPGEPLDNHLSKWAVKSQSKPRLDAMIGIAATDTSIAMRPQHFDINPHLMAFPNGTLNLMTGDFEVANKKDYITKRMGCMYDPDAESGLWEQCLDDWTLGNRSLRDFLQRAVGYSMTGLHREHKLFILLGEGRNGKTTLAETLQHAFGDYSGTLSVQSLLQQRTDRVPNDIAALQGLRFVVASEPGQGRVLDASLIKLLTGGDTMSARFLHKEWFDFKPSSKIWMLANHLPIIQGVDRAIWSRMLVVPFDAHFPLDAPGTIKNLDEKLLDQAKGVVAWGVRGAIEYYKRDTLDIPLEVQMAVQSYEEEMDHVIKFMRDYTIEDPNGWSPWKRIKEDYDGFCEGEDVAFNLRLKDLALGKRLDRLGFPSVKGTGNVAGRSGFRLNSIITVLGE